MFLGTLLFLLLNVHCPEPVNFTPLANQTYIEKPVAKKEKKGQRTWTILGIIAGITATTLVLYNVRSR